MSAERKTARPCSAVISIIAAVEIDFRPMYVAHLQRQRSAPGPWRVDCACSIESKALNLARKIILRNDKEFIKRFRRNFFGSHTYLRGQRRLRFS